MAYYDNAPSHKPQGKKSFGREKWVEEGSEYRGARHGGRPSGKRDDNRAYGEKKSFGDRKPYGEKKSFGDRKPYGEKKSFGDRKPYGEKKSYDDRKSYGEKKSYGDSKPYERRDRYDRRPEMADERPAPSYRDSEYRPVAVAPVMAQPVAEEAVQENLLAGRNPIREALKAGRDIEKLLVQKGELTGSAREIVQMAKEAHIPVQEVEHQRLNELAKNHQGMVAFASAYQWMTVRSLSSPLPRQMRWLIGCAACLAVKSMRSESMLSPIVRTGMALMDTLSPSLRNRSLSPLALSILTRPLYRSTYRSNWQVVLWSALSSVTVNRPCNPARLTSVRMMTGIVPDRVR